MKKIFIVLFAFAAAINSYAQDSFTNYQMVNTTDVFGSARYQGMGGAMGALGADISAISNNPAALALFRRNDISISMGGQIQDAQPYAGDSKGKFSFDQIGFVISLPNEDRSSFLNFGVNFQKKNHYGNSFFIENNSLNGLSQAEQFKGLYDQFYKNQSTPPEGSLNMVANKSGIFTHDPTPDYHSYGYDYNRLTKGNLYGLDFNVSYNKNDFLYLGMTVGFDFLNYETSQRYVEYRDGVGTQSGNVQDYDLMSNRKVTGHGFNIKLGAIVRPFEDSPLRFGAAIETPTWYVLSQKNSYYSIASKWEYNETAGTYTYLPAGDYYIYDSPDGNYLDFNVFSPWKFRLSLGSTVEDFLAWDIEYEYAMYDYTKMGYPSSYDEEGPGTSMDKDRGMSELTHESINGVHNFRAGLEVKPIPEIALRAGYNFWSRPMKKNAVFDQRIDSYSMDYTLGTEWMNLGSTNMFSFGVGYRDASGFYADLAYKYRVQSADFYAFDAIYQNAKVNSEKVKLDRHGFTLTLGYRF